jgi:hypothetical protein
VIVPIYVDGWQLECCGKPFAIGDAVAWQLQLRGEPALLPDDCYVDRSHVRFEPRRTTDEHLPGTNARVDGILVWSTLEEDTAKATGHHCVLAADWHAGVPDDVPSTAGTVRRIRLVTQPYESTDGRIWVPRRADPDLIDLERSPAGFRLGPTREPRVTPNETGVVVDLDCTP